MDRRGKSTAFPEGYERSSARVNYTRNSAGVLQQLDTNDYYPFGLNFINPLAPVGVYSPSATYKNYKYNGKELQETGFYAFKWRQYMPDVGRFFNIDPLAEKYVHNSTYAFSENRVIDARELEGLEAVVINDTTIEWRVKVENNLGSDYSSTLLQDAANILSQNGLTVNIIEDPNAQFTINLSPATTSVKLDENGALTFSTRNGYTMNDGNIYDGTVVSKDNPRTLAHELGHKAMLPHIFDEGSKVPNTEENKKNLMNSSATEQKPELRDSSGTNLAPSQTTDMKNHIRITNENRERKEQELQKQNLNENQ